MCGEDCDLQTSVIGKRNVNMEIYTLIAAAKVLTEREQPFWVVQEQQIQSDLAACLQCMQPTFA